QMGLQGRAAESAAAVHVIVQVGIHSRPAARQVKHNARFGGPVGHAAGQRQARWATLQGDQYPLSVILVKVSAQAHPHTGATANRFSEWGFARITSLFYEMENCLAGEEWQNRLVKKAGDAGKPPLAETIG